MGVLDKVQNARTRTATDSLVRSDKPTVEASLDRLWKGVGERHIEIKRGDLDLERILYEGGKNDLEYIFGDSISALNETGSRVQVTFEHTPPRTVPNYLGLDRQMVFFSDVDRNIGLCPVRDGLARAD